jgi:hypothetical protein
LYFSHHSSSQALSIILSFVGTQHGDPLIGPLFALAHFRTLRCFLGLFLSCFFPSLTNDTRIHSPVHVVSFAFDHFVS